jgi:hypothetical protein
LLGDIIWPEALELMARKKAHVDGYGASILVMCTSRAYTAGYQSPARVEQ